MSNKLCPFCGSNKLSVEVVAPAWGSGEEELHVICDDCASSAPIYIWNKREKSKQVKPENLNECGLR